MASEPFDSFDNLPADVVRSGVHRGPRAPGSRLIAFAWAALATGVLVGLGVLGLSVVNGTLVTSGAGSAGAVSTGSAETATPIPTVEPTVDPGQPVTILNGTSIEGLATRAGAQATDAGWSVGAEANASATDVTRSTVYYSDPAIEGAAKGLASSLGGIAVEFSAQFTDSPLTAVLGTDYKDPAG